MNRIVSLLPSSTEIVCALGFEGQLVGRSHECDYPPSVKHLPVCTQPKFDTQGPSLEIDQRVKAILKEALSIYRVDTQLLRQLRPSHIITQTQCEVCAVSLKDVEQAISDLTDSKPMIVSLQPNRLADVWTDVQRVADALDASEQGHQLVDGLKARMREIGDKARALETRPRVACIEWMDPLMAAGNWVPELVEMAGGINLLGEAGRHSPWMSWEDLRQADPDVILILPCGFDMTRTLRERSLLVTRPGWSALKAVKDGQVYIIDGSQYFNRPGPRLVESLEILAEALHPEVFKFGHEDTGWTRVFI